ETPLPDNSFYCFQPHARISDQTDRTFRPTACRPPASPAIALASRCLRCAVDRNPLARYFEEYLMTKWSTLALAVAATLPSLASASAQSESAGFIDDSNANLLLRNAYFLRDHGDGVQDQSRWG